MSINPLSDIVLDVARAAEPGRLAIARLRLTGGDAVFASAAGTGVDNARQPSNRPQQVNWTAPGQAAVLLADAGDPKSAALRGLEQAFLTQLIELMLPRAGGSVFGSGPGGPMWREMLAEQTAKAMVMGAGTGIAGELAGQLPARSSAPRPGFS